MGQVIIISDTFHEFSEPLLPSSAGSACSRTASSSTSAASRGFKLRIRGQKERIVSGFKSAGFKVAAMGDSMNDLSLLESCDYPVLYRPVEALRDEFPDAADAVNLDEALEFVPWPRRADGERPIA